ncbi:LysR family transcriptional regulator [Paraburkholderia sp. CNPSo 3274]|uniref:LysR family transcriptional regulator n=1 Tax=Paraburkholderia sp. CNPSo 3274 TaxID=2940932 RepID=UPI0020B8B407|nr:LysR family transcriptional regulator [Paraburkholderia sp. CNPSo 3274]MCP3707070.1 LysR family transcriptional regulator [Paraburkholderia sp. CNPSo 3274]
MDWNQLRFFLAVYRHRTLAGASRELASNSPTVSRQIAALEHDLKAKLFLRTPRGYVPTEVADGLLELATRMEACALEIERHAGGADASLSGIVRIGTSDALGTGYVLPAVASVRRAYPAIRIEVDIASAFSNLSQRESDIVVRNVRPVESATIVRRLPGLTTALYASEGYLAEHPPLADMSDVLAHELVTLVGGGKIRWFPPLYPARAKMRAPGLQVNSILALVSALQAGAGIGELPTYIGDAAAGLVRVLPDLTAAYDVWIGTHGDLHRTARVRIVVDAISRQFAS